MEVHHHAHTSDPRLHRGKKKWTHYFWEFLMLFLAVFCGFLAEYQLEHKIEKDRAKELAKSFYEELKADSANIQWVFKNRARKDSAFTYLKKYYRDSSLSNCSKQFSINFLHAYVTHGLTLFDPNDAILQQLINSGSLRYFKSKELQKIVGNLALQLTKVRFRNQIEWDFTHDYLVPFLMKHTDQQWFDELEKRDTAFLGAINKYTASADSIPFHLSKLKEFDAADAIHRTGLYQIMSRSSWKIAYTQYFKLNRQLLEALRKEYNLK